MLFAKIRHLTALSLSVIVLSCGTDQDTTIKNPSFIKAYHAKLSSRQKWDVKTVGGRQAITVPVCWVKEPGVSSSTYRMFRDAIVKEYKRAAVHLQGWQTCTKDSARKRMLRAKITPQSASSGVSGTSYIGRTSSSLSSDGESAWFRGGSTNRNRELSKRELSTALHEIGHGLGLMHEQNRSDSTCSRKTTAPAGVKVGRYDPNSIMNYCRSHSMAKLTKGDIAGLHSLYNITRPATGSLIDDEDESPIEEDVIVRPTPTPRPSPTKYVLGQWREARNGYTEGKTVSSESGRAIQHVCRMDYLGETFVGKLVEGDSCRIAAKGKEIRGPKYELLQDRRFDYKKVADGGIPANAVLGAKNGSNKNEFPCRVNHNRRVELGGITQGQNACVITVGAKVHRYTEYEVLVKP